VTCSWSELQEMMSKLKAEELGREVGAGEVAGKVSAGE
jgi:hypothetical protein